MAKDPEEGSFFFIQGSVDAFGAYLDDGAVWVEVERRDAYLAVDSRPVGFILVGWIDAMVDDIPTVGLTVFAGYAEHRVVGRADHTVS